MLINKKELEKKLCHLSFIPLAIISLVLILSLATLFIEHMHREDEHRLNFYTSLFENINTNSSIQFDILAKTILTSNAYYSINLIDQNKKIIFSRGVNSDVLALKNTHLEKTSYSINGKTIHLSPVSFVKGQHPAQGWVAISKSPDTSVLWYFEALIFILVISISAFFLILLFNRRFEKTLLKATSSISTALDALINEKFGDQIDSKKTEIFAPLATKLNRLTKNLKHTHDNMQHTIDQSLIEAKESLETVEIQNIEIDLARKNALKANQATSDFLANTSHEIRTPINGIIGFSELLRKTNVDSQQQEYIDTIEDSAKMLLLSFNDIIDYSRLEIGTLNLDYKAVNIRNIIQESEKHLHSLYKAESIDLTYNVLESVPVKLLGDPTRIKQIYHSLLQSMAELTHTKQISVYAHSEQRDDNKITLKISFTIPGQHKQNELINKAAYVLSSATPDKGLLTNKYLMNLSIARGLVTRMQGQIGFSIKDQGAVLWFTLELGRSDIRRQEREENHITQAPQAPVVLIVDDNPSNRKIACELLKEMGVESDTADTGNLAIEKNLIKKYSMILMDIQMPEMSGFEATELIRQQEGRKKRTPIIALTAHAVEEEKSKLLISGMDDFISKPISTSELEELLSRWTDYSKPDTADNPSSARSKSQNKNATSWKNPVNISQSVELAKGNKELAKDMLNMLLSTLKDDIHQMQEHVTQENHEALHQIVHRIHGGACYCGVPELLDSSATLDKKLKDCTETNYEEELNELIKCCEELLSWEKEHDIALLFS